MLGLVFVALRPPQQARRAHAVGIVQVLCHPDLVTNLYGLVNLAVALVDNGIVRYVRVQVRLPGAAPVDIELAQLSSAILVALLELLHERLERGQLFGKVPALDIGTDFFKVAVVLRSRRPFGKLRLHVVIPRAGCGKRIVELVEAFFQFRDICIGLHHHAHRKQRRVAVARLEYVHILEVAELALDTECGQDLLLGLFLRIGKRHIPHDHQVHHAFVFHVRKQVHVHTVAVGKLGHGAERKLITGQHARHLVQVVARHLEYGARCRQSKILDIEFALAVHDHTLDSLARRLERLAVNARHLHGRARYKRALLEHTRNVGDDSRIFGNAARNIVLARTADSHKRQDGQGHRQRQQKATNTFTQIDFHPFRLYSNSRYPLCSRSSGTAACSGDTPAPYRRLPRQWP